MSLALQQQLTLIFLGGVLPTVAAVVMVYVLRRMYVAGKSATQSTPVRGRGRHRMPSRFDLAIMGFASVSPQAAAWNVYALYQKNHTSEG